MEIAALPAATATPPWKPPGHEFCTLYVAVQPRVPVGVGDADRLGLADGLAPDRLGDAPLGDVVAPR